MRNDNPIFDRHLIERLRSELTEEKIRSIVGEHLSSSDLQSWIERIIASEVQAKLNSALEAKMVAVYRRDDNVDLSAYGVAGEATFSETATGRYLDCTDGTSAEAAQRIAYN